MKMNVTFAEMTKVLNGEFGESKQQFDVDVGEFGILHDGQNGATFFPAVSTDGVLSWTNDRELPNPDPVCIKGADGKDGADGVGVARVYLKTIGMGDGATSTYVVELTDSNIGGTIHVKNGSKGADGYTPVKGVDYFTDADRADIVAAVIAALPVYGGETE